jgi:hypothetical protein
MKIHSEGHGLKAFHNTMIWYCDPAGWCEFIVFSCESRRPADNHRSSGIMSRDRFSNGRISRIVLVARNVLVAICDVVLFFCLFFIFISPHCDATRCLWVIGKDFSGWERGRPLSDSGIVSTFPVRFKTGITIAAVFGSFVSFQLPWTQVVICGFKRIVECPTDILTPSDITPILHSFSSPDLSSDSFSQMSEEHGILTGYYAIWAPILP